MAGLICAVCKSSDVGKDDDDNWFCRACFAQVQDITLREVNDGDGLGTQHGRTRSRNKRRASADHRKRRRSEAAERAKQRRYSDDQLVEAFQHVLKAQATSLVETFGCSDSIHSFIGELWFSYLELRADPNSSKDLPPVKLPLTASFCALGCFLAREPMFSADIHRAMMAGSIPYLNPAACFPPSLSRLGLHEYAGPLCPRDASEDWEEEKVRSKHGAGNGETESETDRATSGAESSAAGGTSAGMGGVSDGWRGTGRNSRAGAGRNQYHRVPKLKYFRALTKRLAQHLPASKSAYILHCPLAQSQSTLYSQHDSTGRGQTDDTGVPASARARYIRRYSQRAFRAEQDNLRVPAANPHLVAFRYVTCWGLPPELFDAYSRVLQLYRAVVCEFWPPACFSKSDDNRHGLSSIATATEATGSISELETLVLTPEALLLYVIKCYGGVSCTPVPVLNDSMDDDGQVVAGLTKEDVPTVDNADTGKAASATAAAEENDVSIRVAGPARPWPTKAGKGSALLQAMSEWRRRLLQHGGGVLMFGRHGLFRSYRSGDVDLVRAYEHPSAGGVTAAVVERICADACATASRTIVKRESAGETRGMSQIDDLRAAIRDMVGRNYATSDENGPIQGASEAWDWDSSDCVGPSAVGSFTGRVETLPNENAPVELPHSTSHDVVAAPADKEDGEEVSDDALPVFRHTSTSGWKTEAALEQVGGLEQLMTDIVADELGVSATTVHWMVSCITDVLLAAAAESSQWEFEGKASEAAAADTISSVDDIVAAAAVSVDNAANHRVPSAAGKATRLESPVAATAEDEQMSSNPKGSKCSMDGSDADSNAAVDRLRRSATSRTDTDTAVGGTEMSAVSLELGRDRPRLQLNNEQSIDKSELLRHLCKLFGRKQANTSTTLKPRQRVPASGASKPSADTANWGPSEEADRGNVSHLDATRGDETKLQVDCGQSRSQCDMQRDAVHDRKEENDEEADSQAYFGGDEGGEVQHRSMDAGATATSNDKNAKPMKRKREQNRHNRKKDKKRKKGKKSKGQKKPKRDSQSSHGRDEIEDHAKKKKRSRSKKIRKKIENQNAAKDSN